MTTSESTFRSQTKGRRMKRNSPELKQRALGQIESLIVLAQDASLGDLSRRYIRISRKIAERMDITIPAHLKRRYCKNCNTPYSLGSQVRLKNGLVTVKCLNCGDIRRIPYKPSH